MITPLELFWYIFSSGLALGGVAVIGGILYLAYGLIAGWLK